MKKEGNKAAPLARVIKDRSIDSVILAECARSDGQVIDALGDQGLDFTGVEPAHPKVTLFHRSTSPRIAPVVADHRVQFVRMELPGFEDILIGAAHLADRQNHPTSNER